MIKNVKLFLSKIKSSKTWYYFLLYIFIPIYNFLWEFLFNFQGKLYYYLWKSKKKESFDLENNDKLIVENDPNFKKIANDLRSYIDEDFQKKEIIKFNKNLNLSTGVNKFEDYRVNVFPLLPSELKHKIINFAIMEKNLSTATNHLKVFPVIGKIYLFLNFPVAETKERGAMLWHKDDFGYKSLDLFLAINDIDEENGPLYFIKRREPLGVFYKLTNVIANALPGERNKINIKNFSKYFSNESIDALKGPAGNGIFVDSFTTYHRGGHCTSKNRIMLRICYQTPDSIDVQNKISENGFYFFPDLKKENTKDIFHKYLLFKKLNFFWKFIKLPWFLMRIYRILHFKT